MPDQSVSPAASIELFCTGCGYSLHGLPRPVCPECGEDASTHLADTSQIAWLRVKGWLHPTAFWKTVVQVCFRRPARLRFELLHEVDYRHTRAFAWLAAFVGWLTFPFGTAILLAQSPGSEVEWLATRPGNWIYAAAAALITLTWMILLSGLHTYFFHPRSLPVAVQNRTLALSYLAAAPLALLPLVLLLDLACVMSIPADFESLRLLVACGFPAAAALLWYLRIVSFARPLLRNPARAWTLALLWPLAAILLTVIVLVILPAVAFYLAVVYVGIKEFV